MTSLRKGLERKWGFLRTQDGMRKAPLQAVMRLVSWRARCSFGKATLMRLPRWDLQISLPANWRGQAKRVFAFRENYEPELIYLEKLLSPGSVFIDVGANMGIYTLVASRLVGEAGRVIAFEPSAQSLPLLLENIELNSLKNVCAFPVALADRVGKARLYHQGVPECNSLARDPSWGGEAEEVTMETLDNIVKGASVTRVDVIKIDVEGAEELVLRGAANVLASMRPAVIFEVNPNCSALFGLSAQGSSNLLANLGYEFLALGSVSRGAKMNYYYNCVAVHSNGNESS
jgi:FkbM family methyltransferase